MAELLQQQLHTQKASLESWQQQLYDQAVQLQQREDRLREQSALLHTVRAQNRQNERHVAQLEHYYLHSTPPPRHQKARDESKSRPATADMATQTDSPPSARTYTREEVHHIVLGRDQEYMVWKEDTMHKVKELVDRCQRDMADVYREYCDRWEARADAECA